MIEMLHVHNPAEIDSVVILARDIWIAYYVPIIGQAQTEYMLARFQSAPVIAPQIANGYLYYIVMDDGVQAGYFAIVPNPPERHMLLSKIYVKPERRGAGIGKKIMAFVTARCIEMGMAELWLTVNRHNTGAIAFYQQVGFAVSGRVAQDIGNGFTMDDYRMAKTLAIRMKDGSMIRPCTEADHDVIGAIVNDAAMAYKGVIPADRWHEPYMPRDDLVAAIDSGVRFWGFEMDRALVGVMGIQAVQDVTLIRHAYVRTRQRRHGVGGKLLQFLLARIDTPTLVGTWAAAVWAIQFYQKYGFRLVNPEEKDRLLPKYWGVPPRQIETSVVLGDQRWFDTLLEKWIRRYYPPGRIPEVMATLAEYGRETWHRESRRVKRDAVIVSRGSLDALKAAIQLAARDYRDVLIGEEVDPWVIGELKKYGE